MPAGTALTGSAGLAAASFVFPAAATGAGVIAADFESTGNGCAADAAIFADAVGVDRADRGEMILPAPRIGMSG